MVVHEGTPAGESLSSMVLVGKSPPPAHVFQLPGGIALEGFLIFWGVGPHWRNWVIVGGGEVIVLLCFLSYLCFLLS